MDNRKVLLMGNAAVARGLYESGCQVVSSYPGTPSTEITEETSRFECMHSEWAPNEKVAVEVAVSAAIGGARSFAAMKHVGLNVAADPLFTSSYTGINAGLIIAVADDPGMHSSQNEQDSRYYARSAKIPMLEPSDSEECISFVKMGFELSEKFDTPVLLRLSTRVSHSQSIVELNERTEQPLKDYVKNPAKYVMVPANAKKRHIEVEKRLTELQQYVESTELNRIEKGKDSSIGIITSGISYEYVKEAMPDVSVLKLGIVNPLPIDLIKEFASSVERLVVVEELEPIIETHCKALGLDVVGKELFSNIGEINQNLIREKLLNMPIDNFVEYPEVMPNRPPVLCPGCPHRGVFYTLNKLKLTVMGDIGCYSLGLLPPLSALDTCICMGASVSGSHGMYLARGSEEAKRTVSVIGDSTFIHSGITGLINAVYNGSQSTLIIMDNSITGMTGHQHNPTTGFNIYGLPAPQVSLEEMCHAAGVTDIHVVDPANLDETRSAISKALEFEGVSVVIARRPCILLKTSPKYKPLVINEDKCVGCKKCLEIGCPAISMKNKKSYIDTTLCVGCDLCTGLCPVNAIEKED